VDVRNDGDVETTVHWHGLRLENRFDGVPHETQAPIPIGGGYSCRVQFPDAGFYWYHPHMREDFAQEMGLYGTIVVEPTDPAYWPAVDRELTLTLDDLLVEEGHVAAFSRSGPNFTAMGRFGNVLLINGEDDLRRDRLGRPGGSPLPGEHGEHPAVQLRAAGRADEVGRRGQRPLRARDVH
jgi:FtsP/CotA-like multicopper oxidase with cupredoxin domain